MRLQVTVQRHGLPPANILWTSSSPFPHHVTAKSSTTVAQLIEDINDVIPLESGEWGLEDYVAEVAGYECLHYQPVESILKEDDKVIIRALQSSDLRSRRYAGRHQLTSDGRHLIDGVPYGRPFTRKSDRPEISIPSRKRKRSDSEDLTGYDVSDFLLQTDPPRYLGSHLISSDPELDRSDPLYHGDDYDDGDEDEDDDFVDDASSSGSDMEDEPGEEMGILEDEAKDLRLLAKEVLEQVPPLPKRRKSSKSTQLAIEPSSSTRLPEYGQGTNSSSEATTESNPVKMIKSVAFEDEGSNSETSSKISTSQDLSAEESDEESSGEELSSDSSLNSNKPGDDWSSRETSYDSSDSSSASSSFSSTGATQTSSDNADSSRSISTSSSISSPELGDASESGGSKLDTGPERGPPLESGNALNVTSGSMPKQIAKPHVPHGQGTKRTKQNNVRQKKRKRLARLKEAGVLGPEAGFQDLDDLNPQYENLSNKPSDFTDEELNAKRDTLIRMLDEQEIATDKQEHSENHLINVIEKTRSLSPQHQDHNASQSADSTSRREVNSEPAKKRLRLDIGSSRRMLFGSLGLKVPKSQSAERELREKLADEARKGSRGMPVQKDNTADEGLKPQAASEDDWKDKLDIAAVECTDEGVSLTAPPFPFVQRWDKQAIDTIQMRKARPGFSNKSQSPSRKVQDESKNHSPQINSGISNNGVVDDRLEYNKAVQDQLMRDATDISALTPEKESSSDDLPMPPEDLASLTDLRSDNAQPGSVIVYQTLEIGEDFQPRLSRHRTARVNQILEDGVWEVTLAKRDLKAPVPNLTRLHDFNDEAEDSADSLRRLKFENLISPKLLNRVPSSENQPGKEDNLYNAVGPNEAEDRTTAAAAADLFGTNVSHSSTASESFPKTISTPRRQQISDLIRDAGFDSGLNSGLSLPKVFNDSRTGEVTTSANIKDDVNAMDQPTTCSPDSGSTNTGSNLRNQESAEDLAPQSIPSPHFAGFDSSPRSSEQPNFEGPGSPDHLQIAEHQSATPIIQYPSLPRGSDASNLREGQKKSVDYGVSGEQMLSDSSGIPSGTIHSHKLPEADEAHLASLKSTVPPTQDVEPSPADSQMSNPFRLNYSSYDGACSSDDDLSSGNSIPLPNRTQSPNLSPLPLKVSRRSERWSSKPIQPPGLDDTATDNLKPALNSLRFEEGAFASLIPEGSQVVDLTISSSPISLGGSDGEYLAPSSSQRKSGWRPQTRPIRKGKGSNKIIGIRHGKPGKGKGSQKTSS